MNVCVIGLGKIGLPLSAAIASKHHVIGFDINHNLINELNAGIITQVNEPNLEGKLKSCVKAKTLIFASDDLDFPKKIDVFIVAVPLLLLDSQQPDFSALDSATAFVSKHMNKDSLIIYETTLPIGTTRKRFGLFFQKSTGHIPNLVFSPERVFSGNFFETLGICPKIVGAINSKSANLAKKFYETFIEFIEQPDLLPKNGVWVVNSLEEAEFCKLAETTYRDVNIALANTFALHAKDINVDISTVIKSANSQPYSHIHKPGINVGGHCIPVYPRLYEVTDSSTRLISLARDINDSMPQKYIELIEEFGVIEEKRVLILGIAYRGNVKESYMSGALVLNNILKKKKADVLAYDPLFTLSEIKNMGFNPVTSPTGNYDIVILQADHDEFLKLSEEDLRCRLFVDGRAYLDAKRWPNAQWISLGSPMKNYAPTHKIS
jgi:nucleotide sugar dehydrogenase